MMLVTALRFVGLFVLLTLPTLVNAQCAAGFNSSATNTSVTFTSTATGSFTIISYDFGDGNNQSGVNNPTHTYAEEGVYSVCQFIQDFSGSCIDFYCDTIYTENGTCSANMNWFDDGLTVDFFNDALGTYDSTAWHFGDGNSSSQNSPTHTYSNAGTYNVCLEIYEQGSLCDSVCETIVVDSTTSGGFCDADFTSNATGLTVVFSNLSTGNYTTQIWDFGDQLGTSFDNNPTYTYLTAGTYEVCLVVLDSTGGSCFDQYCMDVTVSSGGGGGGPCEADFSYEISDLSIDMEDESSGAYITALWDYGDGSLPSINPNYTYEEAGEYEVCLTILNPIPFCADTYCETVEVIELTCEPSYAFSFDPTTNSYSFSNTTTVGNVSSVEWDFGDGNTSTFSNPTYAYNSPGVYEVCLSTFDEGTFCGVFCDDVEVYALGTQEQGSNEINVFPNPATDNLSVSHLPDGKNILILRDLSGRSILRKSVNAAAVSLPLNVAPGTYLLEVSAEKATNLQHFRIVVEQ